MVSNLSTFIVTWLDESDGYSTTAAVTTDVIAIPLFTDTGSGEVNECEIVLTAKDGKYLNTGNVIQEYDRFRIQCTDLSSNSYDRYFEVIEIIPSQTKGEGALVTLKCLGIEYHTQLIHYSRQFFFTNPENVSQDIGDVYEANNGSRQPLIDRHDEVYSTSTKYGNDLPKYVNNHFEFGLAEDTCYNRWMDIIDQLGASVNEGGDGEFYELGFDTGGANLINLALFKSGARSIDGTSSANDSSLVTIKNTTSINVSEQEGGISNPTATRVLAWGSPVHGSLPLGFSKYRGEELEFLYRPQWKTGLAYKVDALVLNAGKHYTCAVAHTSGTFATDLSGGKWTQVDMSDEFGDSIQYSPWTDDKAKLWADAGSRPNDSSSVSAWGTTTAYTIGNVVSNGGSQYVCIVKHTSGTFATDLAAGKWEQIDNAHIGNGAGFFDGNLVQNDNVTYRTWVNVSAGDTDYSGTTDKAMTTSFLHSGVDYVKSFRFLNISNTFLSGTDRNGRSFTNAVCEWQRTRNADTNAGEWVVIISPDSTLDKIQVADIYDGLIWEWNNATSKWLDVTTVTESSITYHNADCFHQYHALYNIKGVDPRPSETDSTKFPDVTKSGAVFSTNIRSAVEVAYKWSALSGLIPQAANDCKVGAWINFSFPFPINTENSISEGVGDLFGGGTNEKSGGITEPALLDTQNMSFTPTGLLGFNQSDSESLGPLQALAFYTRLYISSLGGTAVHGNATLRVTMTDIKDNVVTQDAEVKFTAGRTWQELVLPISGFQIYRGRASLTWGERVGSIADFKIPIKELDIQDIFEFRNIKHIAIQIQDYYDEEGRYDPVREPFDVVGGGTILLAVDGFHFKKPLLAASSTDSTRNTEAVFLQRPQIISYKQLKNVVASEQQIQKFKHKEFNFSTSGKSLFDVRFGDSIFLQNSDLIVDTDDTSDGSAKKVKLVAKRIEYHLTKPSAGPGGISRTIKGVKRFSS